MFILDINPIAFSIGSLSIYWYGIIYAISVLLSWKTACIIIIKSKNITLTIQEFDKFMFIGIIMCVIFARIGHIVFFEFKYYISHPIEILMIRNGGMSFHGGVIGIIITTIWFSKKYGHKFSVISDILSFAGSLGIFIGRVANFLNQELYGTVTSVNWAVIFSKIDMLPRHPTQIYESLSEGLLSYLIMLIFWYKKHLLGSGIYTFIFLITYSVSRYIIEFLKEVEIINYFNAFSLTTGQLLSIVLSIIAIIFIIFNKKNKL